MVRQFLNFIYGIFLTIKCYRRCQEVVAEKVTIINNRNIESEVYDDEFYKNNPFYNN